MLCSMLVRVISGRLISVVGFDDFMCLSSVMFKFFDLVFFVMLYGCFRCK